MIKIKHIILCIIILLTVSCEKEQFIENDFSYDLNIYDYIIITGTDCNYATMYYETNPVERIFWTSPDTIIVDGEKTCIVCCSTYSNSKGLGQQSVLLPNTQIYEDWIIIGYNNNVDDTILINW